MAGGVWRAAPKGRLRLRQALAVLLTGWLLYQMAPINEEDRVTVMVAPAVRKDMPVYLDIPGTVQAYQTVTVHAQAEGQLAEILFEEGQDVKAGDPLARLDPRSYQTQRDEAIATKTQDEAMLAKARNDLAAYKKLGAKAVPKILDAKRSVVRQFEASVASDQVTIDHWQNQLDRTVITSPIDGRTGIRQVDAGNRVKPTDSNGLVVITQMDPIAVMFNLPQKSLLAVGRNLDRKKKMTVLALDKETRTILDSGELEMVDNKVDPENGTIRLKAAFPNTKRLLWPGGKVLVRLQLTTRRDALVVPASAIQPGTPKPSVFIYRPASQTVEMRPVKLVMTQDDEAVIEDGVRAGEQVVTDSMRTLEHGTPAIVHTIEPQHDTARE